MRIGIISVLLPVLILGSSDKTLAPENLHAPVGDSQVTNNVVTIYFIRHAQSVWNKKKAENADLKKQQKSGVNLDKKSNKNNEPDSPLSEEGFNQVADLSGWWHDRLLEAETCSSAIPGACSSCTRSAVTCLAKTLKGEKNQVTTSLVDGGSDNDQSLDDSATQQCFDTELKAAMESGLDKIVFATSNLKRAIETLLVFFSGFFKSDGTPVVGPTLSSSTTPAIHIVSALQETSLGKDAASSLSKKQKPFDPITFEAGKAAKYQKSLEKFPNTSDNKKLPFTFNADANEGNGWVPVYSRRYAKFCDWVASTSESTGNRVFVISGHSSWLLEYFIHAMGGHRFGENDEFDRTTNLAEKILRVSRSSWDEIRHKLPFKSYKALEIKLGNASMIKFELKITKKSGFKSFFSWSENRCEIRAKHTQLLFGNWQVAGSCQDGTTCSKLSPYLVTSDSSSTDTCPIDAYSDDDTASNGDENFKESAVQNATL